MPSQTTPFDIPQILQRQSEMNDIINSTTANLTEQHNAIADDLSTKKRQIAFAYSQQRRNYAYNKILLLLISSFIISIVIYYVNENFKLLPSVMITLLISIIFSISIIWGYYIFLEIMSRSSDNYDELNLGTLDTFGTILEGATILNENTSIVERGNTIASIEKNILNNNKLTIAKTEKNKKEAAGSANKSAGSANKSGAFAKQSSSSAIRSSAYSNQSGSHANMSKQERAKAQNEANKSLNSAKDSKASFYRANHMAHWGNKQARNAINQQKQVLQQGTNVAQRAVSAVQSVNNKTVADNNTKFNTAMDTLNEAKTALKQATDIAASVADTTAAYTETDKINSQLGFTTLKYALYY